MYLKRDETVRMKPPIFPEWFSQKMSDGLEFLYLDTKQEWPSGFSIYAVGFARRF